MLMDVFLRRLISSFLISAFVYEMARLCNSFLATYLFFVLCIYSRVLNNWGSYVNFGG